MAGPYFIFYNLCVCACACRSKDNLWESGPTTMEVPGIEPMSSGSKQPYLLSYLIGPTLLLETGSLAALGVASVVRLAGHKPQ